MKRLFALSSTAPLLAALAACASEPPPPDPAKLAFDETKVTVPGFVDFLSCPIFRYVYAHLHKPHPRNSFGY